MLRFSLRRRSKQSTPPTTPFPGEEGAVHVNRTSNAWLNFRKRTISVESVSSLFTSIGRGSDTSLSRRESQNSISGASLTSATNNSRLMRTHKMILKSGSIVEIYFGYDALTIGKFLFSLCLFKSHKKWIATSQLGYIYIYIYIYMQTKHARKD